jgi:hypothetical protein
MKADTLNALVAKLTAFDGFAELKAHTDRGYVPTILYRDRQHIRLAHLLRQAGVKVWTGA